MDEKTVVMGGDFKLNVSFLPIGGFTMDDVDFAITLWNCNRRLKIGKEEMVRVDSQNYVACVHSEQLGKGVLNLRMEADFPDSDFQEGVRKEVDVVMSVIKII